MADLEKRSDKLLIALGTRLANANAKVLLAIAVWQQLVVLEERLKGEKALPKPNLIVEQEINRLEIACKVTACQLKKIYNEIWHELKMPPDELAVVIGRLDKDYGDEFKAKGL